MCHFRVVENDIRAATGSETILLDCYERQRKLSKTDIDTLHEEEVAI
jgi:hypothetical protein